MIMKNNKVEKYLIKKNQTKFYLIICLIYILIENILFYT